ncbi:hypothetical protein JYP52_19825 [Nitratireductor aquibiodomus]|uniref:hypothetical protein n=1 Tax=Nitratireductor aquibiodomus TaxID=204799 RepID=UPI0019D3D146|nr:hypothetical protein [Nitratireductor aquibiodomus]MBN7763397.1 hypothetical protein [Nitratireductor aquibiodomus]
MNNINDDQISDVAFNLAVMEMVRLLIAEVCFDEDPEAMKQKLGRFEDLAVSGLSARQHFDDLDQATNTKMSELAAHHVTKIVTSIRHYKDA